MVTKLNFVQCLHDTKYFLSTKNANIILSGPGKNSIWAELGPVIDAQMEGSVKGKKPKLSGAIMSHTQIQNEHMSTILCSSFNNGGINKMLQLVQRRIQTTHRYTVRNLK